MRRRSTFLVHVAAGWGLALSTPVTAAWQPASFFEIEHVVGEDGIRDAEQSLIERIAGPGVAVEQARAALENAGASYVRAGKAGRLEFLYVAPETFVTIFLRNDGAVVTSVQVTRLSLGG
ncbi:hypothetical protein F1C10_03295 [Sphingomonas sp. NBWT7]|uniref:hypothetical protein n=1 Tax=Sphingomonas sp. NBWT7 TaxID=2596913 RepID=UPI001628D3F3|nr:hypothetical protein [Sphingomonas sp. NBWT7]QNE31068.1 hypothetical protein F1C10_03295 [Sphingomonas sp. NBWT7]